MILLSVLSFSSISIVALSFLIPASSFLVFNENWALLWLVITHTGDVVGVGSILLLASVFWSVLFKGKLKRLYQGVLLLIFLLSLVGGSALVNEYVIKQNVKMIRPSIKVLEEACNLNSSEYYSLDRKADRQKYLYNFMKKEEIEEVIINNKKLPKEVLQAWIKEAGFSFPSGHSVSAFLIVSILCYLFVDKIKRKHLWVLGIFYLWAIAIAYSRVIIGVHTSWDVTIGALWGTVIGFVLIRLGAVERFLIGE